MKINEKRLKSRMDEINAIAVTENGGMMRLALTDADKVARDLLCSWMEEAGMVVKVDDMGSIYGKMVGTDKNALPICIGSHMDTQPDGGKYDGLYGVMAALEAVCTIKDSGITTKSDLIVIDWTNEEGARFVPPLLASGVVAGTFEDDWVLDRVDNDGLRYGDEVKRIGYAGQKENRIKKAKAYFEPHIEQGPVLDAEGFEFGIVTGVLGIIGLDVTVLGEANHAGTTPMSHRKDALVATSDAILKMHQNCIKFGGSALITNGVINAIHATKNIVPGQVCFSVDMRYHNEEGLAELEKQTKKIIEETCNEHGVTVNIERYWTMEPVHYDKNVIACVSKVANEMGLKSKEIISGAGHDAVFISNIIPTGMCFVPSIKGMSHCPQEDTKWVDLVKGVEATANILLELDK